MSNTTNLDEVRRHALDIVEKSERRWKRAILIFGAVEGVGWFTFIVVAWFGFSIAILLGVAVLILYTMIFTWAVALKEHMDTSTQRILKAIEAASYAQPEKPIQAQRAES
jgi:predicted RND superfamily exporter protein